MSLFRLNLRACMATTIIAGSLPPVPTAWADVRVDFDAPLAIQVAKQQPAKLSTSKNAPLQITLPVSSIIETGQERQLVEFVYRIEFLSRRVRVVKVSPSTTLSSEIKGDIGVEEKRERKKSAGVNLSGKYQDWLRFSALADAGRKSNTNLRFQRRPAQRAVIVSGNIHRSRGAFVKFRPDLDRSLEGVQPLRIWIDAPHPWNTDLLHLECVALGKVARKTRLCGRRRFLIAVHRGSAKPVRKFLLAKQQLIRSGTRFDKQRQAHSLDNALRSVAAAFGSPGIPADWLTKVVYHGTTPPKKLPPHLLKNSQRYLAARKTLLTP